MDRQKVGSLPPDLVFFFLQLFHSSCRSSLCFSDSYLLHWVKKLEKLKSAVRNSYPLHWLRLDSRCSPRHHTPPLLPASLSWSGATAAVSVATKWGRSRPPRCIARVQTARRAMCNLYAPNNFVSPLGDVNGYGDGYVCLSRTRHLSAPGKASKPLPRISIRNGFTRPTGDINVNSPLFTKRLSGEEIPRGIFVICHFSFGDRPLGGSLQQLASDTGAPMTFPHCKQRSRLFDAIGYGEGYVCLSRTRHLSMPEKASKRSPALA